MTSKETAIKISEEYLQQIKNIFPWADVSKDSIQGRSFHSFHDTDNSWNRIEYNYSFDTPLNSSVNISIYGDVDMIVPTVNCSYRKDYGSKEMSINGKTINDVFVEDAPISEQLANIRLLLVKRKV